MCQCTAVGASEQVSGLYQDVATGQVANGYHVTYLSPCVVNSYITSPNSFSSTYCPTYIGRDSYSYCNVRGQVSVAKHEQDLVAEEKAKL